MGAHCSYGTCDRPKTTKGLCIVHYQREKAGRDMDAPIRARGANGSSSPCAVDGCSGTSRVRGLCTLHYSRWRTGAFGVATDGLAECPVEGCPSPPVEAEGYCRVHFARVELGVPAIPPEHSRRVPGTFVACDVPGCTNARRRNGLCGRHSARVTSRQVSNPDAAACSVDGCDVASLYRSLCPMHYSRWKKHGEVGPPERLRGRFGDGHITKRDGYHIGWKDGRLTRKHHEVMEQIIGRPLFDHETVHHKNGVRSDNDPSNLELWASAHPYGQRVTDLISFVCRFYPAEVQAELSNPRDSTTS